jgi:hypothetical protein
MQSLVVFDGEYPHLLEVITGVINLTKHEGLEVVLNQSLSFTPGFWATIFPGLDAPSGLSDEGFLRVLSEAELTPVMIVDGPRDTIAIMQNSVQMVRDQHFIPDVPFRFIAAASRDVHWAEEQIRFVNERLYGGE